MHGNIKNSIEVGFSRHDQDYGEESTIEEEVDPSSLTITEKLTSTKWQHRQIAYRELAECFETGRNTID